MIRATVTTSSTQQIIMLEFKSPFGSQFSWNRVWTLTTEYPLWSIIDPQSGDGATIGVLVWVLSFVMGSKRNNEACCFLFGTQHKIPISISRKIKPKHHWQFAIMNLCALLLCLHLPRWVTYVNAEGDEVSDFNWCNRMWSFCMFHMTLTFYDMMLQQLEFPPQSAGKNGQPLWPLLFHRAYRL